MVTKVVNAKTGQVLFETEMPVPNEVGYRFMIGKDDDIQTYIVIEEVPLYNLDDRICTAFIYVEPATARVDPRRAAPGYIPGKNGFYDKYIVAKSDGSPIKDGAEYLVLNIAHDRAAQQAAKLYCDAQRDPAYADFVDGLIRRVRALRKKV